MSSSSAARSNLGPLTSVFTPAPTCTSLTMRVEEEPLQAWRAQSCVSGTSVEDDLDCWPSTSFGVPSPTPPFHSLGFYSPGLACPLGYTTACTAAVNSDGSPSPITSGTTTNFQYRLEPGETAAGCCPSGYFCTGDGEGEPQTCKSFVTNAALPVVSCVNDGSTTKFRYNLANAASGPATPTLEAFAPLIQLVYQQTDVDAHTIVYPTVTVTRAATTDEATGLDTGEQAAIGVGVVALLLLSVAIVFGWLLLRQRRWKAVPQELPGYASGDVVAEKRQSHQPIREIEGRQLNELGGSNTVELPERGYK